MSNLPKLFNIKKINNDELVMGPLPIDSCYIELFPIISEPYKLPKDLEIGEVSQAEYNLCGCKRETYHIVRIQ